MAFGPPTACPYQRRLGHQPPIHILISGFQPPSPILAPGSIPPQAVTFPYPEAAFRQIIVHTTSLLIAQIVPWRGQSERIVRLSTAKCCREYLTDAPVDNELQINCRQAIPPKKLTSNVLLIEKKCYLRRQSSHKRRWK